MRPVFYFLVAVRHLPFQSCRRYVIIELFFAFEYSPCEYYSLTQRVSRIMAAKESRASKIVEYNDGKLWFHHKAGIVTIGITLSALDDLGDVESIDLPSDGDDFDKEDTVCTIEGSDGSVSVFSPAAGFVVEVNEPVGEDHEILSEDPIDEGWLVKLEIQDDSDLKEYI